MYSPSINKTGDEMCKEVVIHKCDLCYEYFKDESSLTKHILEEHFSNQLIEPKCETIEIPDEMCLKNENEGKI